MHTRRQFLKLLTGAAAAVAVPAVAVELLEPRRKIWQVGVQLESLQQEVLRQQAKLFHFGNYTPAANTLFQQQRAFETTRKMALQLGEQVHKELENTLKRDPHLEVGAHLLDIPYEEAERRRSEPDVQRARHIAKTYLNFGAPAGFKTPPHVHATGVFNCEVVVPSYMAGMLKKVET